MPNGQTHNQTAAPTGQPESAPALAQEALRTLGQLDIDQLAQALNVSPERVQQTLPLLQQLFAEVGRAQARELLAAQKREARPYRISEQGLAQDILQNVSVDQIQNETIKTNLLNLFNEIGAVPIETLTTDKMNTWLGRLQEIYLNAQGTEPAAAPLIDRMLTNLTRIIQSRQVGQGELGGISFTLSGDEIKLILSGLAGARKALEYWVSQIEATNYRSNEPMNQSFLNRYLATIAWLPLLAESHYVEVEVNGHVTRDKEEIRKAVYELINEFRARIHIHDMQWAIETTNWELIQHVANDMGSATLFEVFKIKGVATAFNLCQRLFDRYRFAYGQVEGSQRTGVALWRITPEVVALIKEDLVEELVNNRIFYGFASEAEARRVANIGLTLFNASMREGVHVARGAVRRPNLVELPESQRSLRKEPAFQSDPNEVLVNLYNPLQFMIEKWTRFGEPQEKLLNKILEFLGEGDIMVGRQKFNNLIAIVDYFSSGWRIINIYEATQDRLKFFGLRVNGVAREKTAEILKRRLDSLSTGLLLQRDNPFSKGKTEAETQANIARGKERLKLAAKYRPLALLQAYGVTLDYNGNEYSTDCPGKPAVHARFKQLLASGQLRTSGGLVITNYVTLERVLGRYIYPIYEKAMAKDWAEIHGIDIGHAGSEADNPFDQEDQQLIRETVDAINQQANIPAAEKFTAEDLQQIYRQLQDFLLHPDTINDLATNSAHSHLYDRALYLDDAPLAKLQEKVSRDIIPISQKLFVMEGGRRDPYARMWGDTASAYHVLEEAMGAITSRDVGEFFDHLKKAMGYQTGYAGRPPYLNFLFNIGAGWLSLTKVPQLFTFFDLYKLLPLPFSQYQQLFGLAAPAQSTEDLRRLYEKMTLLLGHPQSERGIAALDQRFKKELGIEGYKVAQIMLTRLAIMVLFFVLQAMAKQASEDEK